MAQRNNILQELNELQSSLANISPENPYSMHKGYFETLADPMLNTSRALEEENPKNELKHLSPLLSSISKQMPYSVPAGFFDEVEAKASTIAAGKTPTAAEELKSLSPLLSGLKKEMPY